MHHPYKVKGADERIGQHPQHHPQINPEATGTNRHLILVNNKGALCLLMTYRGEKPIDEKSALLTIRRGKGEEKGCPYYQSQPENHQAEGEDIEFSA